MKPIFHIAHLMFILFLSFTIQSYAQTPNWQWAKSTGGVGDDLARSISADASGNTTVIGYFTGTADFDPDPGVFNLTSKGGQDIYLARFNGSGGLIWAKAIGGTGEDNGYAVSTDAISNIYIAGHFNDSVDFNPDSTVIFNLSSSTGQDIFIAKYDVTGNLIWAKAIGDTIDCSAHAIALDDSANVYITGFFAGKVDFDPGADTLNLSSAGGKADIFVARFDSTGNFTWAKKMGGTSNDYGNSITVDHSGGVFLTGTFEGTTDFDPGTPIYFLNSFGGADIFVSKLDASGNFLFAKHMGGTGDDFSSSIALDASGNILTTGSFTDTADFSPGGSTFNLISAGNTYIFVSKLDQTANFIWAKAMGGPYADEGNAISINSSGQVYTTGLFAGIADFNPGPATSNIHSAGLYDIFLSKLDASGNFVFAKRSGGTGKDNGLSIALDQSDILYLTGSFTSDSLKFGNSTIMNANPVANLSSDIFIAKLSCINSSAINISACYSYVSPSTLYTWTASGLYSDTIPGSSSCDSVIAINLTIDTINTGSFQSINACNSYTSPSGLFTWTSSGTYTDTVSNSGGCDSVLIINLTISSATSSTLSDTACNSLLSPSGHYTWATSGSYVDTIPNSSGCDSIITINLFIKSAASAQTVTSCFAFTPPSGNYTWTSTGTYKDTIPGALGCDSIITYQLTINSVYLPIFLSGTTLNSPAFAAIFQWLNCDSMYTPIPGETNSTFTPTVNGSYAVSITQNGCTDTSLCKTVIVTGVGIQDLNTESMFEIYPNPSHFNCILFLQSVNELSEITISDFTGKLIYRNLIIGKQKTEIDLKNFDEGIYFMKLQTGHHLESKKLIVIKN